MRLLTRILGIPPIHPAAFVLAKAAFGVCWLFLLAGLVGVDWSVRPVAPLRIAAIALLALAAPLLILSLVQLGTSTRVGLPAERTTLKTTGLYAISRNPMYVAMYLSWAASALYVLHPLNVACAIVAIALHHRITLAEERFLAERFGQAWDRYAARVHRYL